MHTFICIDDEITYEIDLKLPNPVNVPYLQEDFIKMLDFHTGLEVIYETPEEIIHAFEMADALKLEQTTVNLVKLLIDMDIYYEELVNLLDLDKLTPEELIQIDLQDEWLDKI